jgi:hypothetical protein
VRHRRAIFAPGVDQSQNARMVAADDATKQRFELIGDQTNNTSKQTKIAELVRINVIISS